jgi:nitrite reductase/ring-hydroxylating ferredoxin subunit
MKELVLKNGKYLMIFALFVLMNASCDDIDSQIPDVYVNFPINLSIFNELTIPGNSMYFQGPGFGGIIVYCEQEGFYFAFDAACTNEITSNCRVEPSGLIGTCSCCESKFIFIGGYLDEGPASAPLKQYKTSLYGNMLRVYN